MADFATARDRTRMRHGLTRREYEALGLLAAGLRTVEAAQSMGVSLSTLNALLASARRRLGVRSTALALLALQSTTERHPSGLAPAGSGSGLSQPSSYVAIDLLARLSGSATLAEAHRRFESYLAPLGIVGFNFGVIADPAGLPVSGPVTTRFSVPEFRDIYLAGGGPAVDPTPAHAAQSTNPIVVDPELAPELIRAAPKGGRRIAEYLLDNRINRQVCLPGRDSATGAPFAINLIYEHCSPGQLQRALAAQLPLVQRAKQIFWEFIQDAAFFCDEPGLTNRERQALLLIVRGCTLVETAERLGTSVRMAERLLAGARRKLGARNNAQAVYRAIVYRAL